jgi:hypothetical protein
VPDRYQVRHPRPGLLLQDGDRVGPVLLRRPQRVTQPGHQPAPLTAPGTPLVGREHLMRRSKNTRRSLAHEVTPATTVGANQMHWTRPPGPAPRRHQSRLKLKLNAPSRIAPQAHSGTAGVPMLSSTACALVTDSNRRRRCPAGTAAPSDHHPDRIPTPLAAGAGTRRTPNPVRFPEPKTPVPDTPDRRIRRLARRSVHYVR